MKDKEIPYWLTKKHILFSTEYSEVHYSKKQIIQNNLKYIWYYTKKIGFWILSVILIPILITIIF